MMQVWVSPSQAIARIGSFQTVAMGAMCAEPPVLALELARQAPRLEGVALYISALGSPCPYAKPSFQGSFRIRPLISSLALKEASEAGMVEYLPVNFSEAPRLFEGLRPDIALIQATPPDDKGRFGLGLACDYTLALARSAKCVIAEVNPAMPRVFGEGVLDEEEISLLVEGGEPPYTLPKKPPSKEEDMIALHVAGLIPDGATIEIGVGSLAGAILKALEGKKDLSLHTGTFPEEAFLLIEKGVIQNTSKGRDLGRIVASNLAGTEALYAYAKENPLVELRPTDYTHHARTLSTIPKFFAINQAIEVDLAGQINAERLGGLPVGGVAGQADFMRGAVASYGGASIVALPSTAKGGSVSRIVPSLAHVTSAKSDVHAIVTEFGVARLFGQTLPKRAEALIGIAHPAFQKGLEEALKAPR
jgi:4-hydroxybutyrate CoA-transferase